MVGVGRSFGGRSADFLGRRKKLEASDQDSSPFKEALPCLRAWESFLEDSLALIIWFLGF